LAAPFCGTTHPPTQRARIDVGRALAVKRQAQVAAAVASLEETRTASLVGRDLRLRAQLTDRAAAAAAALEAGVAKWLARGAGKRELAEQARRALGKEDGPVDRRALEAAKQQARARAHCTTLGDTRTLVLADVRLLFYCHAHMPQYRARF
jgi:hypothetical protein